VGLFFSSVFWAPAPPTALGCPLSLDAWQPIVLKMFKYINLVLDTYKDNKNFF
jgi:hypothetical protein